MTRELLVRRFLSNIQTLPFPEAGYITPSDNQPLTVIGIPVSFDIMMTFLPKPLTVMMAEPALHRLKSGIEKLT